MSKLLQNRVFRFLVCLVLVLSLLVNLSPLKAESTEFVAISSAAILGITAWELMMYLGFVSAPPDTDILDDLGEAVQDFLEFDYVPFDGTNSGTGGDDDEEDEDWSTEAVTNALKTYTDYVGDALTNDTSLVLPDLLGGFAWFGQLFFIQKQIIFRFRSYKTLPGSISIIKQNNCCPLPFLKLHLYFYGEKR